MLRLTLTLLLWGFVDGWLLSTTSGAELPLVPKEEGFSLVVLSDTQDYADRSINYAKKKWGTDCTRYFEIQTRWVKQNAERLNIRFLAHTGDITQMNQRTEWTIAQRALSHLDGVVPYALCAGNHDMGCVMDGSRYGRTAIDRESHLDEFFPPAGFRGKPWFAGTKTGSIANAYYYLEHRSLKFLLLTLEFKPRDETLAWANRVVAEHPDRRVIVLTHGYLNPAHRQNSYAKLSYPIVGNEGQQIWTKFVQRHANIFLVLCGHTQGEGRRTDRGRNGNPIHQILADYRHLKDGGGSWLRCLVFYPSKDLIDVFTYNPALDQVREGISSRFSLQYDMSISSSVEEQQHATPQL